MPNAEEIIARYANLAAEPNVWFAPNIPSDVLERALGKSSNKLSNNDVLLLVGDWTKGLLWGKNDNFLLITKDRVIGCEPYIRCSINFSEITKAHVFDNGDSLIIGVNEDGNEGFGFFNMSRNFCDTFCDLLNDLAKVDVASLQRRPRNMYI